MNAARPITHLLLDLDGTLLGANNFAVFAKFSFHMLRQFHSRSGSLSAALRAYAGVQRAVLAGDPDRRLNNATRASLEFAKTLGISHSEADVLLHGLVADFFPRIKSHFFPIPGAREFIDWARPRFPMVLATNPAWKEPVIRLRLDWAGIDPANFRFITHSERMYATKPDLIYYEDVLSQSGFDAGTTLLIGDDPRNDLPAVQAGISVFLLSQDGPQKPESLDSLPDAARAPAWRGDWSALRSLLAPSDTEGLASPQISSRD